LSQPFIAPAAGAIEQLATKINIADSVSSVLKSLHMAFSIVPKDPGWVAVLDRILAFAKSPSTQFNNEPALNLLLKLYLSNNQDNKNKVSSCIETQQFLQMASTGQVETAPSLAVLYAYIHKEHLLNCRVTKTVLQFWQSEQVTDITGVVGLFAETETLSTIFLLAKDPRNLVAARMINELTDKELYRSGLGVCCLNNYSWATSDQMKILIGKLENAGGIKNAQEEILGHAYEYRQNLSIINKYGNSVSRDFVDHAIKEITAEEWFESFQEGSNLLKCLNGRGNHHFKDGFTACIKEAMNDELSDHHIWKIIPDCISKLIDAKQVLRELTQTYFASTLDKLTDDAFESINDEFINYIGDIQAADLTVRLEHWIAQENWFRIEWLLSKKLKFKGTATDSLKSRIEELVGTDNDEINELLLRINTVFKLGLDLPKS